MTARKSLLPGLMMCGAALLAYWLIPGSFAAQRNHVALERMVPDKFGVWRMENNGSAAMVNPDLSDALASVYAQVLSRSYVDDRGNRVMLSIAYSTDQRENAGRQTHRPELCYPAQGFSLSQRREHTLGVVSPALPVVSMVATQGRRIEPLTYWMTLDGKPENNTMRMKWDQIRSGLAGTVQDGLIFRVSTIDPDIDHARAVQEGFLRTLSGALDPAAKHTFFGTWD